MDTPKNPKRHRPTADKIELDVYFLPERLPDPLRHPLEAAGGPDAMIRFDHAEAYLSPSSEGDRGWQVTLTICPPGEGHFMGIDLSIAEAKRLIKTLEYVVKWQKDHKARAKSQAEAAKRGAGKSAKTKKAKDQSAESAKGKAKKKKRP